MIIPTEIKGRTVVAAWVSVKNAWSEPVDLEDLPGILAELDFNGDEYRVQMITETPPYTRFTAVLKD